MEFVKSQSDDYISVLNPLNPIEVWTKTAVKFDGVPPQGSVGNPNATKWPSSPADTSSSSTTLWIGLGCVALVILIGVVGMITCVRRQMRSESNDNVENLPETGK
jgi:hypothetical protein